jgi:hypothetical protein
MLVLIALAAGPALVETLGALMAASRPPDPAKFHELYARGQSEILAPDGVRRAST